MIIAQNLYKSFGGKNVVNGVSFEILKGQSAVILGPNGAGKTTILRLLSSLLSPDRGDAWVNGYHTLKEMQDVRKNIGVLTELPGLYPRMTLYEYLFYFGKMYGMDDSFLNLHIERLGKIAGLYDMLHFSIESFSKGMKQKASLLRAMIHNPDVLLLDEPTSALDPRSAKSIRDYLLELREEGKTILVCTHNLYEAETLAAQLFILKKGDIIFSGTPDELKKRFTQQVFKIRFLPQDGKKFSAQDILKTVAELALPVHINECTHISLEFTTQDAARANPALLRFLTGHVSVLTCEEITLPLEQAYLTLEGEEEDAVA